MLDRDGHYFEGNIVKKLMVPNFVTLCASGKAGQINKHIVTLGGLINYIETNHRCFIKK